MVPALPEQGARGQEPTTGLPSPVHPAAWPAAARRRRAASRRRWASRSAWRHRKPPLLRFGRHLQRIASPNSPSVARPQARAPETAAGRHHRFGQYRLHPAPSDRTTTPVRHWWKCSTRRWRPERRHLNGDAPRRDDRHGEGLRALPVAWQVGRSTQAPPPPCRSGARTPNALPMNVDPTSALGKGLWLTPSYLICR